MPVGLVEQLVPGFESLDELPNCQIQQDIFRSARYPETWGFSIDDFATVSKIE